MTRQRQIADFIQKGDYDAAIAVALSRRGRASEAVVVCWNR